MRCLELYSGIGGFAVAATANGWNVVEAIDINELAASVYSHNFGHAPSVRTIESLPRLDVEELQADLWWMSPPCQPFTRRGPQRDTADSRTESFLHVVELIRSVRPPHLALENVPQFVESVAAESLRDVLRSTGYQWLEFDLCSTEFGLPNRRRRFYIAASRVVAPKIASRNVTRLRPLREFTDDTPDPSLFIEAHDLEHYREALHTVRLESCDISACFTSAYGKSPIRSGSWIEDGSRLRRFSPDEILRLLGFPKSFTLPAALSRRQKWKLVGNSLSIPSVQHVLRSFDAD